MLTRRVFIVDGQPLFRAGVRRALEASGRYVVGGEAGCAHTAIDIIDSGRPDLVLMSVQLPGISGLKTARIIRRKEPRARIVLFSLYGDDARLMEALQIGAAAMLPRDLPPAVLVDTLDRVMAGDSPLRSWIQTRPGLASRPVAAMRAATGQRGGPALPLSTRELAVLDCASQGLSNKQIAAALYVTEQTVKNHFTSVLRKLDVDDRVGAILHAVQRGWVEIGPPLDESAAWLAASEVPLAVRSAVRLPA